MEIENIPKTVHIGGTSRGYNLGWYSVKDGRVFNFALEWKDNSTRIFGQEDCLQLTRNDDQTFSYEIANCFTAEEYFVCSGQKELDENFNSDMQLCI